MKLQIPLYKTLCVVTMGLTLGHCTTKKNQTPPTEPSTSSDTSSQTSPSSSTEGQDDLPPELRDAGKFDPATTLNQSDVQDSDFYQVRKSLEDNRDAIDASWKEQDRIESTLKASAAAEEQKKNALLKAEEEERERQRQKSVQEFEKTKGQKSSDQRKAEEEAEKLPTIKNSEVEWKGLED